MELTAEELAQINTYLGEYAVVEVDYDAEVEGGSITDIRLFKEVNEEETVPGPTLWDAISKLSKELLNRKYPKWSGESHGTLCYDYENRDIFFDHYWYVTSSAHDPFTLSY